MRINIITHTVATNSLVGQPKKTREQYRVSVNDSIVGCAFFSRADADTFVAEIKNAQSRGNAYLDAFLAAVNE